MTRQDLGLQPMDGPVIIEEDNSMTVVMPGWQARLDEWSNVRAGLGGLAHCGEQCPYPPQARNPAHCCNCLSSVRFRWHEVRRDLRRHHDAEAILSG